jgi:hypothetical protein
MAMARVLSARNLLSNNGSILVKSFEEDDHDKTFIHSFNNHESSFDRKVRDHSSRII